MNKTTTLCQALASNSYFSTRMNRSSQLSKRTSLPFAFTLVLTFLLSLVRVGDVWGQVATYNYAVSSAPYTEITGGTVIQATGVSFDDAISGSQTINSFVFNGSAVTTMAINTNGWMSLGVSTTTGSYVPLSGSQTNGVGILAPFGRDQQNSASSEIRWQYLSVSNETVIQWKTCSLMELREL